MQNLKLVSPLDKNEFENLTDDIGGELETEQTDAHEALLAASKLIEAAAYDLALKKQSSEVAELIRMSRELSLLAEGLRED